jgi:hypothetical protein
VPQVLPDTPRLSGENILLGDGSVDVSAEAEGNTYTTVVDPHVTLLELRIGHTVPRRAEISSVTLNDVPVEPDEVRNTNRGKEVIVEAPTTGEQTLVVETAP